MDLKIDVSVSGRKAIKQKQVRAYLCLTIIWR
jgi:hypothetical protein